MNSSYFSEGGGVLVWILIAVALFAALSYTMVREGGTGAATRTMSDAQARLHAAEIVAYGTAVQQTVRRLMLRGCAEEQLNFANNEWKWNNGDVLAHLLNAPNPNAPPDGFCDVFGVNGGKMMAKVFPEAAIPQSALSPGVGYMPGSGLVAARKNIAGIGTAAIDVHFQINMVREEVCLEINKMAGINLDTVPIENGTTESSYDNIPELRGKSFSCTHWYPSGWSNELYYVIFVLIAR